MCTSNSTGSFFFFFLVALIDIYQNQSDLFFKTITVEITVGFFSVTICLGHKV